MTEMSAVDNVNVEDGDYEILDTEFTECAAYSVTGRH